MNHRMRRGMCLLMLCGLVWLALVSTAAADGGDNGGSQRRPLSPTIALTVGAGWTSFGFAEVGTTAGPLTFTTTGPSLLKITDAYCAGDRFRVYDNGQLLGETSAARLTACTFTGRTNDPAEADAVWAYSHGAFALPAGAHSITIQTLASPFGPGGAFVRVDLTGSQSRAAKPARWQNAGWTLGADLGYPTTSASFAFGPSLGPSAVVPLMCDWDGNGSKTPGVFVNGRWTIRNSNSAGAADTVITFGQAGDTPVCGDWDGNGTETVGVVRGNTWLLRNTNTTGIAEVSFVYGQVGDRFVVGDWNGDNFDTPGVFRNGTWYLRNSNTSGASDIAFTFNPLLGEPVVGDWDGDGRDGVGIVRGNTWFLRNSLSSGNPQLSVVFGNPPGWPLVWR